jgi:hypothetical protein
MSSPLAARPDDDLSRPQTTQHGEDIRHRCCGRKLATPGGAPVSGNNDVNQQDSGHVDAGHHYRAMALNAAA